MIHSSPKHKVPTRVYSLFTFVVSGNVFCQGMIVLLNPGCLLLSGMLHVYNSEVRFRDVMPFENRPMEIVELFSGPMKLEEVRRKEVFHTITHFAYCYTF